MNKTTFAIVGIITLAILGAALFHFSGTTVTEDGPAESRKPRVVATAYPLAEFSRMVGGADAEVVTIVPPGLEPHEYEPTPKDIISITEADIFVMNGAGLDPWAERAVSSLGEQGVLVINTSSLIPLLSIENGEETPDPHFWLDPVRAVSIIEAIRDALIKKDSAHTLAYTERTAASQAELAALDEEYRTTLSSCVKQEVIASHGAFSYLAQRYGFTVHSIAGLSPEVEPSAGRMADLALLAKKKDIRYIFFEKLVSPKVSETLAREVGAETLLFDPIEGRSGEDSGEGKEYFLVMRQNLTTLSRALECARQG